MNQSNFPTKPKYNLCQKVVVGKGKAKRTAYIIGCEGTWELKTGKMVWAGFQYSLVKEQELLKQTREEVVQKGFSFVKHESEITLCF